MKKIKIADKFIGQNEPCFIIAEIGSNHNGNMEQAKKLIDAAAFAGADAVKFQTFTARRLIADMPDLMVDGMKKVDYFKQYELPYEWHEELFEYASRKKIVFLSTPFDESAAGLLDKIGVPCFKISSFELVHFPLLKYIASKKKPVILSTGMADLKEIKEAVNLIKNQGNKNIALLHCNSSYPVDFKDANIKVIQTLKDKFDMPVGYSDHSMGMELSLAAVALGASIIEKHFTLDRQMNGPDHKFAIEPDELKKMVKCIRNVELSLGSGIKRLSKCEEKMYKLGRRSIFSINDIKKGQNIEADDIAVLRPNLGLHPRYFSFVCRKKAKIDIAAYTPVTKDLLY